MRGTSERRTVLEAAVAVVSPAASGSRARRGWPDASSTNAVIASSTRPPSMASSRRSRGTLSAARLTKGISAAAGSICTATRSATPPGPAARYASTPNATAAIASPANEPAVETWSRLSAGGANPARSCALRRPGDVMPRAAVVEAAPGTAQVCDVAAETGSQPKTDPRSSAERLSREDRRAAGAADEPMPQRARSRRRPG